MLFVTLLFYIIERFDALSVLAPLSAFVSLALVDHCAVFHTVDVGADLHVIKSCLCSNHEKAESANRCVEASAVGRRRGELVPLIALDAITLHRDTGDYSPAESCKPTSD